MDARRVKGQQAEALAAAYLEAQGFCVRARNLRAGTAKGPRERAPELDIVATRASELWVIEVKFRSSLGVWEAPLLNERQRRRLYRGLAAFSWLGPRHLGLLWVGAGGRVEFLENP